MKRTTQQNSRLHGLLNALKLIPYKASIIMGATDGRSESSKDLTYYEADVLISHLSAQKKQQTGKMAARIIHLCCVHFGMVIGDKPDYKRINKWVKNIGTKNPKNKHLHALNKQELNAVLSQIEVASKKQLDK